MTRAQTSPSQDSDTGRVCGVVQDGAQPGEQAVQDRGARVLRDQPYGPGDGGGDGQEARLLVRAK